MFSGFTRIISHGFLVSRSSADAELKHVMLSWCNSIFCLDNELYFSVILSTPNYSILVFIIMDLFYIWFILNVEMHDPFLWMTQNLDVWLVIFSVCERLVEGLSQVIAHTVTYLTRSSDTVNRVSQRFSAAAKLWAITQEHICWSLACLRECSSGMWVSVCYQRTSV